MQQRLILSFVICEPLTLLWIALVDHTGGFILIMILHIVSFLIMACVAYILKKAGLNEDARHLNAFCAAYMVITLMLWRINGGEFAKAFVSNHTNRGYWSMIAPVLISNILAVVIVKKYFTESKKS